MPLIFIRMYTEKGKTLTIEVDNDESIGSIKERLHAKFNIPVRQLELYHGVKKLQNDKTLRQYNFKENSFSGYVYVNFDIEIKIIPEHYGKPFLMQVEPNRTVFYLKQLISKQLPDSPDPSSIDLIYYGKKLSNDKCLDECHVKQNSSLYMNIVSEHKLFHGIAYKSMNFQPTNTYLRKSFADVSKNISMSKLPQVREE